MTPTECPKSQLTGIRVGVAADSTPYPAPLWLPADDDWDVLSLVGDSIETIMRTHSRYFGGREVALA